MPIRVYYEVLNQKGTPALYSDNYAQRPAAGYVGRIFYSPDTAQIFYDTGSTWTLLADAGVGSGSLASVCANGNTTATGISITAGGLSSNSITNTSNTAGSVLFAGASGVESQSNATFFWDNTNKRLGLGNNAPGVTLDIHGTGGTLVQLNGTGTNNAYLQFQNAGVGKWRIGNQYQGGTNSFGIYNNSLAANALTIDNTSNVTLVANLTASSGVFSNYLQSNVILLQNAGSVSATVGYSSFSGNAAGNGFTFAPNNTNYQTFIVPTGVNYTYTFPSVTGTIALTSNLSSYLPLAGGTLTGGLSGTSATFSSRVQVTGNTAPSSGTGLELYYDGSAAGSVAYARETGYIPNIMDGSALQFFISSSEKMRVSTGGFVGIGTITPATLLNLKSSTTTELRLESTASTYRSMIGFRTDGQKWDLGVNLNDVQDAFSFNYTGVERIRCITNGNVQINGAVYRYNGQTVVGGSFTNLTSIDLSSSRTYLIQMIPTNVEATLAYRIFGVLQANATSATYTFVSLASQTMDIQFSGTTVQARVTNGQQWTFNWTITQLL